MRIKNNQELDLLSLKNKLEKELPKYKFEVNGNAITASKKEDVKMNIVEVEKEFWVVEAVPFQFKLIVVIILISLFAYWVQSQGWHWGINVSLYVAAFVVLGYAANWIYGVIYAKKFKKFKLELKNTLKNALK